MKPNTQQATETSTFNKQRSTPVPALNLTMEEFVHPGTGARHLHLESDNPENVFMVALKTVPEDSTGVAHILEHTVLCGSEAIRPGYIVHHGFARLEVAEGVFADELTKLFEGSEAEILPHPDIKKNDTVKFNFATNDVETVLKFDNGATVFATGGNNIGRVGVLQHVEHHPGSYEIAHVRDSHGNSFATRLSNIFVIGSKDAMCSLPRGNGIKLSLIEERDRRDARYVEEEQ